MWWSKCLKNFTKCIRYVSRLCLDFSILHILKSWPQHCTKHAVKTNLPSISVTYIFWMKSTLDENSQMSLDIAHMKVNFIPVHLGKIIPRKTSLNYMTGVPWSKCLKNLTKCIRNVSRSCLDFSIYLTYSKMPTPTLYQTYS